MLDGVGQDQVGNLVVVDVAGDQVGQSAVLAGAGVAGDPFEATAVVAGQDHAELLGARQEQVVMAVAVEVVQVQAEEFKGPIDKVPPTR